MQPSEDDDLIGRVANRDTAAVTELYRRHHGPVYTLCLRFTGDADAAEDLAQEVLLRVVRRAAGYRGEAATGTWVYSIARNLCRDYLRRSSRRKELPIGPADERPWDAAADAARARELRVLEDGLLRLAIEDREVIVLARFVGLGSVALAEVLECTPGAARVRLHRAMVRLRSTCIALKEESDELQRDA